MALVCLCRGNFYWPPHTTILFCSIFLDKIVLDTLKSRYHRSAPLGIPVVIVELKSPSREETDASAAYRQLRNYIKEIPSMFIYNAICVMSDQMTSKAGTITSGEDRFME